MAAPRQHIEVKVLSESAIPCDRQNCDNRAHFLFRSGRGPITAYCDTHAEREAVRFGVALPEDIMETLMRGDAR
jgi:hypothetical protein